MKHHLQGCAESHNNGCHLSDFSDLILTELILHLAQKQPETNKENEGN